MKNQEYKTLNPPHLFFILKMDIRTLCVYYSLVQLKLMQISLKGKQKYETHTSEIYTMIFDYTYICDLSQAHILFEA